MLTGEYFVLDGAEALALPTRLGQTMVIRASKEPLLRWISMDCQNICWFEGLFDLPDGTYQFGTNPDTGGRIQQILYSARQLNPGFLKDIKGVVVETYLEFPRNWGLGSSSTLISMIAEWAKVNPFQLLDATFGGSGYDIACAKAAGPIVYSKKEGMQLWRKSLFNPLFKKQLYFVFLGKKQNSREGIKYYHKQVNQKKSTITRITEITRAVEHAESPEVFTQLLEEHEAIVSLKLKLKSAKELYFPDYWSTIKSLGAWGGDFLMAYSNQPEKITRAYFREKGYEVVIPYHELIIDAF